MLQDKEQAAPSHNITSAARLALLLTIPFFATTVARKPTPYYPSVNLQSGLTMAEPDKYEVIERIGKPSTPPRRFKPTDRYQAMDRSASSTRSAVNQTDSCVQPLTHA
jgi:hypothetical protein